MNPLLLLPLVAGPVKFLLWVVVIVAVIALVFYLLRRRP
jgi:hypothetical protein